MEMDIPNSVLIVLVVVIGAVVAYFFMRKNGSNSSEMEEKLFGGLKRHDPIITMRSNIGNCARRIYVPLNNMPIEPVADFCRELKVYLGAGL